MAWLQFVVSAALIIVAGTRLTKSANILSSALGLGSGWAGILLLPLATSLPELVTSMRAVMINAPDLAAGNLFGSNLFNVAIIAVVDLIQGKGPIFSYVKRGHTRAAFLSILLIGVAGAGILYPFPLVIGNNIGLDTVLLMAGYLIIAFLLTLIEKRDNTLPLITGPSLIEGKALKKERHLFLTSTRRAVLIFAAASAIILIAGVALTDAADSIALKTGLGKTFVGSIMLALATSLPEVVTTSTAARMGKLDMAVGNIFGANIFNMFILSAISVFYFPGSLLQALNTNHLLTIAMVVVLTSVAVIGFTEKAKRSIGWFSTYTIIIVIGYLITIAVLFFTRGEGS